MSLAEDTNGSPGRPPAEPASRVSVPPASPGDTPPAAPPPVASAAGAGSSEAGSSDARPSDAGSSQVRSTMRAEWAEAGIWLVLVAFGLVGTAVLARSHVALGLREPPWQDGWQARFDALIVVPVTVAAIILAVVGRWASASSGTVAVFRLPWPLVLVMGYAGSLLWTLALALITPGGVRAGLRAPTDLVTAAAAIGSNPLDMVAAYTDRVPPATAGSVDVLPAHPPGPLLAAWALARLGLSGAVPLGIAFTLVGALTVPVVCVAVRSLCHETAARRLVPILVLAPWSGWMTASPDAVTALLAALAVAVGVVGCEPGRRDRTWWALASGVLLGLAALFGYAPVWLGVAVAAAYFVRRRPLLNVVTGLGALLPLFLFAAWGFSWPDGLALARVPHRPLTATLAWVFLDLTVALLGAGPVAVRAARRLRHTPGWPFLVGAAATALFAALARLAEGGTQRTWLPLFPWLLVAAVAPHPRPAAPGDRVRAGTLPVILISLGAAGAITLRLFMAGPS
ncbi:DUF4175 domain-containing protein [Frankia sp. Ag45/Mut15]|uniref:DUF4175 domain-containing protein n=1 Tax=Frankia umida TaxID=573489 RepID=A0ABT0JY89_9ACTN|nr:DUF4175 domain-containing protein [Frankia umida]MCK9876509.1 DUF4175 domain-containing protein [Frankia umida]